jgi:GTP-binding protein HflX
VVAPGLAGRRHRQRGRRRRHPRPGERQIEIDRRLGRDRISALKRRLGEVKAARATMRAERERAHLPQIALAGYTNAGKSTLLNQMTGATVGVRDRLFHTLDPSTRQLRLNGRPYLLTDTVGFIRKLPTSSSRRSARRSRRRGCRTSSSTSSTPARTRTRCSR